MASKRSVPAPFAAIVCASLLALCLSSATSMGQAPVVRIVTAVDESRLATLTGNTHPLARREFDRGQVAPELVMGDLVLVLRRGIAEQKAFDKFVAAQYDPASPSYHQWLTPAEIGERYGPAQSDVDAVANWLRNHGLRIDEVTKDRLSIRFTGTASQVESAFHTQMHSLAVKHAGQPTEQHVANMADPQIPAALATVVVGVKALHNFFPKPLHKLGGQVSMNHETGRWERLGSNNASAPKAIAPTRRPQPQFGTVDGYGDVIQDVTPYDFATIYNVLPLWQAATPIDGTGQKIAIAGTSNINLADVASFRSAFGLPVKAPSVVITNSDPGNCASADPSCYGDLVENTLDVEWAGAVAKAASVILVTSSAATATTDPLYLSENYVVQHKTAPVLNVSYGECELLLGNAGNTLYNNLWQTAASEGIAVIVASGDSGSPSCDQGYDAANGVPYAAQFGLSVSGLTSTPYNTSVGGTDMNWGTTAAPYWSAANNTTTKASALGYVPEVPWNDTCTNPLILPTLQNDATYIGVTTVTDTESACNFLIADGAYIYQNYGLELRYLVDTIGGSGGVSACTTSNGGYPSSCGGGYAKPGWQAGVTGIPADAKRDVPDVSFFASSGFLGSAYLMCVSAGGNACTYSATAEPTAQEVGGTSVGSPAMAGVMALINQKSGAAQGNPNSLLYSLAAKQTYTNCSAATVKAAGTCVFNDVNAGTIAMPCVNGSPNCTVLHSGDQAGILAGYSAKIGYDHATGLGSLNIANVVNNWPTSTTGPVVSLSPASLIFASTPVNTASTAQKITLKNTGKGALLLSGTGNGISVTGTNASSFTQTNTCGTSLAASASCVITVTFKPTVAGALSGVITIGDNAYGSPQTVALSGTGATAAAVVKISADSLTFSSTAVGSTNTAPAITLSNTGTGLLALSSIAFTGTNASSFTQTNTCGTSVAAGASCKITITFKPTITGSLKASLTVSDNVAGSPQNILLSGTATAAALAVSLTPASLSFASTAVGSTTAAQAVTVKNVGTSAITLSAIAIAGSNASSFLKAATTCGTSLASNATCTVSVQFKPVASGALTANLTISDNVPGSRQTVALKGTGGTTAPVITLSPTTLTFATTGVGSTTTAQLVTVKNSGTVTATLNSKTITGTNATSFLRSAMTCGATLAAGATCTISVEFKPIAAGAMTALLAVTDNAAGSPQLVMLKGTGTTPITISVTPTSLTFASTTVGIATVAQVVTIKNTGTTSVTLNSKIITGTNVSSFTRSAMTCGATLAAAASCTVSVTFKPAATGALTANLTLVDNAVGSPQSILLKGTGK